MIVKFSARFVLPLASILLLGGCDIGVLDNYDEPTSVLKGQVVFEGVPVGVRSNGVPLELWQPGFALSQKVPVYVDQDGSFFRVRWVDAGRALEYVGLYVATTAFVDRTNLVVRTERLQNAIPLLNDPINLRVELPANLVQRKEVYVRIGVKTVGVAEMPFSLVPKVALCATHLRSAHGSYGACGKQPQPRTLQ
jgi:hypothetical protein